MRRNVTLFHPDAAPGASRPTSAALPSDLQDQVRRRVRLLAGLLLLAFSLDHVIFAGKWAAAALAGQGVPADVAAGAPLQWMNLVFPLVLPGPPWRLLAAALASAAMVPLALLRSPHTVELDDLVLSCLAKDPAARPPTARELSQRLAAVALESPWTEDLAKAWWRPRSEPVPPGELFF